jgi:Ni2+-binding GTPase involved in maturation of urease and hydrogenase
MGVETGGCPHTAIRENASMNLVGANLGVMEADTLRMRAKRPFVFTNFKSGEGVDQIAKFVIEKGGLAKESDTLIR